MAKQKGNVVTHGLSGKVGDLLVFRQRDGQTIVSKMPERTEDWSEKQVAHRKRFKRGVIYAQKALTDPEKQYVYSSIAEKKKKTPFNVAVADFLNAPEIENVDLSNYTGTAGDTITVMASDDVMVKTVHISIFNSDGLTVEEGEAIADASGYVWTYTAVQDNDSLNGSKIVVAVSDLPGNVVEEVVTTD